MGDDEIMNQGAGYVAKNYFWESAGWWWSVYRRIRMGALFQENNNPTVAQVTEVVYGRLDQEANLHLRQATYNLCREIFG